MKCWGFRGEGLVMVFGVDCGLGFCEKWVVLGGVLLLRHWQCVSSISFDKL